MYVAWNDAAEAFGTGFIAYYSKDVEAHEKRLLTMVFNQQEAEIRKVLDQVEAKFKVAFASLQQQYQACQPVSTPPPTDWESEIEKAEEDEKQVEQEIDNSDN